jgi:hypothetical protein
MASLNSKCLSVDGQEVHKVVPGKTYEIRVGQSSSTILCPQSANPSDRLNRYNGTVLLTWGTKTKSFAEGSTFFEVKRKTNEITFRQTDNDCDSFFQSDHDSEGDAPTFDSRALMVAKHIRKLGEKSFPKSRSSRTKAATEPLEECIPEDD